MASKDPIAPRAVAQPKISALERWYYLSLLSMAAIDLLLSGLFLALSGKLWVLALRLPEVLVILVGINLAGGYWLFGPIRRFLSTGEGREAATERAARLGTLSTRWVICVSIVFTIYSFIITPFIVFDVPFTREVMYILVGRALAWIVLLPYVAVFMIQEHLRGLRRALFERFEIVVPAGNTKLGHKLALVLLGGAVVPAASIAITLLLVPEISPITGQPRSVVIITTLVGAVIALSLAFWATERSTTAGFHSLLDAMREMERGESGARVVIETDDEVGRLGEGFNALSGQLERSKAETLGKEQERARAVRQFHEAQKREALGQLAGEIAHDFNNILAIIMMASSTVRKRLPEEDDFNRKRMDDILGASHQGKDLILRILDFTRDRPVEHGQIDLAANLHETINLLEDTIAKEADLTVDIPKNGVIIEGDATGLHQVVANLSINALHAMKGSRGKLDIALDIVNIVTPQFVSMRKNFSGSGGEAVVIAGEDGSVKAYVGLLRAGRYARIRVTDSGSGMSPDTLRQVFAPYFTTKPAGEGTGLGLAAVAGIIAAHGGGVSVETAEGRGTSFYCCIPCPDEAAAVSAEPS